MTEAALTDIQIPKVGSYLYCPLRCAKQAAAFVRVPPVKFAGHSLKVVAHNFQPQELVVVRVPFVAGGSVYYTYMVIYPGGMEFFREIDPPRDHRPSPGMRLGLDF